jgi:predicted pyridoxine 5'-phosphate oxidase superfamily flavin-nucleotide-binding protein
MAASPFHPGERAVQERAGEVAIADRVGEGIGDLVPPAAAEFLAEREMVVLAARAANGDVWATLLTGAPGFVRATGLRAVEVGVLPPPGDPLAGILEDGSEPEVGLLAIDPATRRRMRVNGRASRTTAGLAITATQVFANCPKYIRPRQVVGHRRAAASGPARHGPALSDAQQAWVARADTFFVGTTDVDSAADASHRGGAPGFVQVVGPDHLRFPDYRGNSMYMTLGNLDRRPAIGLLFVDWEAGGTLQLTGTASVDHDLARARALDPKARRLVDVTVTGVVELPGRSPLSWRPLDEAGAGAGPGGGA